MKTLIASAALLSIAAFSPALAADLPVKAPPVAVYQWTGWYAGLNAGYGWQDKNAAFSGDSFGTLPGAGTIFTDGLVDQSLQGPSTNHPAYRQALHMSGFVGGGQFGYNLQVAPRWVTGFEADLQYSGLKSSALFAAPDSGGGVDLGATSSHQLEWFGTLRARLGYLVNDRLLAFGTAGLAYGETKGQAAISIIHSTGWNVGAATTIICNGFTTCLAGAASQTSAGWTAGGGLEYAIFANTTLKAEYLHIDLGDQTIRLNVQSPTTGNGFVNTRFSNAYDIVRAGVNFRY
jgi:outer membrane immunogenic protein